MSTTQGQQSDLSGVARARGRRTVFDDVVTVLPWLAQPDHPLGTAILLPGGTGGVFTPLLHWSATLLTQSGWSVIGVTWDEARLEHAGASTEVTRCAQSALERALSGLPVLVVAKSLGTLALPWAVENGISGAWLTPLLHDETVVAAVARAQPATLLVGGSADPHWRQLPEAGDGVDWLELPHADHGLQRDGDWHQSLVEQIPVFDRVSQLASQVLRSTG